MIKRTLLFTIIFLAYFSFAYSNEYEGMEKKINNLQPYPEELKALIVRGLVAFPKDQNRTFLSWRLLPSDPVDVSFNVYRKETLEDNKRFELIAQTGQTSYIDNYLQENHTYTYIVKPIKDRTEGESSREAVVTATKKGQNALIFNIGDYKQARIATGDLNGDGELEVIIIYANDMDIDPWRAAWKKSEDTLKVAAFLFTGERLWTIDLGWGIEAGNVYSPMIIWDIDADGCAEVLLKTNKDPFDYVGERIRILDGKTGKRTNETKWPTAEGLGGEYNSNSRNYIAIAHLDGKNPYIIVARGLYDTQRICAYDHNLNKVWERVIGHDPIVRKILSYNRKFKRGWERFISDITRGSHSLPIADVNEDGKEEIMWGEHCIGESGKDLWVCEHTPYNGQPDVVFVGDIVPSNKGKEIYYCREGWGGKDKKIGMLLADNKGKILWAHWGHTHVDGGWVAKILPDIEGMQCYGFDMQKKKITENGVERGGLSHFLWSSDGKLIGTPDLLGSFPVDWNGDGIKEICMKNGEVQKYNGPALAQLGSGTRWGADLFGDHREEIIATPKDGKVYIIFNTEMLETKPRITRIADRQYKNDLSRTAMQSHVIPTEGGYFPKMD